MAMNDAAKRIAVALCLPLCLLQASRADAADAAPATSASPASPASALPAGAPVPLDALGVELVSVSLSAADFLVDLRYRVKNAALAQALLDRKVQPVLVNESTGDRFYVPSPPKVGALRQTAGNKQVVQTNRVYFMLFANPDRKLRTGEKVTLYAGDSIVRDIVIR